MSLRTRLVLGMAFVLVSLALVMIAVARSQHEFLVDQLDDRLSAARPMTIAAPPPITTANLPSPGALEDEESALSDLYLGRIAADGTLHPIIVGLIGDSPSVTADQARDATDIFTAAGANGHTTFRVLTAGIGNGEFVVLATPLTEVNEAHRRLVLTLTIAWGVVLLVLSLSLWWMIRLGLRPIKQITATADAIAGGSKRQRVELDRASTETGRLALAFNAMLDERDRAEQQLRAFVADASHELRTPLTSVRGYLDLVLEGDMPAERTSESLRRARSEAHRMGDLVEDLFLLAQLDQGRALRHEPVDLDQVVVDAASDARAMQPERRVDVHASVAGDASIVGDEFRLRQVVAALVHNALVHTAKPATITLTVRSGPDVVEIDVADDGPGLPDGFADRAFDRFSRVEHSRSRHAGGAGLGLAISRSIVEAHDGTISAQSPDGRGCTFRIRLPRRPRRVSSAPV